MISAAAAAWNGGYGSGTGVGFGWGPAPSGPGTGGGGASPATGAGTSAADGTAGGSTLAGGADFDLFADDAIYNGDFAIRGSLYVSNTIFAGTSHAVSLPSVKSLDAEEAMIGVLSVSKIVGPGAGLGGAVPVLSVGDLYVQNIIKGPGVGDFVLEEDDSKFAGNLHVDGSLYVRDAIFASNIVALNGSAGRGGGGVGDGGEVGSLSVAKLYVGEIEYTSGQGGGSSSIDFGDDGVWSGDVVLDGSLRVTGEILAGTNSAFSLPSVDVIVAERATLAAATVSSAEIQFAKVNVLSVGALIGVDVDGAVSVAAKNWLDAFVPPEAWSAASAAWSRPWTGGGAGASSSTVASAGAGVVAGSGDFATDFDDETQVNGDLRILGDVHITGTIFGGRSMAVELPDVTYLHSREAVIDTLSVNSLITDELSVGVIHIDQIAGLGSVTGLVPVGPDVLAPHETDTHHEGTLRINGSLVVSGAILAGVHNSLSSETLVVHNDLSVGGRIHTSAGADSLAIAELSVAQLSVDHIVNTGFDFGPDFVFDGSGAADRHTGDLLVDGNVFVSGIVVTGAANRIDGVLTVQDLQFAEDQRSVKERLSVLESTVAALLAAV